MANVVLENLTKAFDGQPIIRGIDLEIADEEFLVLVGPSGCGKSTVLRLIAGLETVTGGTVRIGDRVVNDVAPKDRDIAMVFQNYALYPHMKVYDNMAFGLKMRKFPRDEIRRRVLEAAKILDLDTLLERKPRQLSGGQRQRVALGRAIVRNPQVFLMDEPLSNLDAKLRVQMRSEISRLQQRLRTTTIYVTHDQVEAMTMGQRIVILKDGQIQQVDKPLNIYEAPANLFVAGFIGQMNFLRGELHGGEFKFGELSLPLPEAQMKLAESYQGKKLILGIRPEHFSARPEDGEAVELTPELIEVLGSEKVLHFVLNGQNLIARVPPEVQASQGQSLTLYVQMDQVKLFDPDSEVRLGYAAKSPASTVSS